MDKLAEAKVEPFTEIYLKMKKRIIRSTSGASLLYTWLTYLEFPVRVLM